MSDENYPDKPGVAKPPRLPMNIKQQADYISGMVEQCRCMDGNVAGSTWLFLSADDVADLKAIAARLDRMAPHEAAIKRIVTAK